MAADRTRRGVAAVAVLLAIAIAVPARSALPAIPPPRLVSSSFETGWVSLTRFLKAPPAWDATDPPASFTRGVVEFITTAWDQTLVDDPAFSYITVTDSKGVAVPGVTLYDIVPGYRAGVYDYAKPAAFKGYAGLVMTFLFQHQEEGVVIDHLKAGGAPYTVSITAAARNPNGSIGQTVTLPPQVFAIDRQVPPAPALTSPTTTPITGTIGCSPADRQMLGPAQFICNLVNQGKGVDPITWTFPGPGSRITIRGTVGDPLTFPFEDDLRLRHLETSGIAAVVVRLYGGSAFPSTTNNNPQYRKTFFLPQTCTDTHPLADSIPRCPQTVDFELDLTPHLTTRFAFYAFDFYAIDLSGLHHPLSSTERASVENLAGPETDAVTFFWTG